MKLVLVIIPSGMNSGAHIAPGRIDIMILVIKSDKYSDQKEGSAKRENDFKD